MISAEPSPRKNGRSRVPPHVIEPILNHQSGHKRGPAGTYNELNYPREVRAALAMWHDHVRTLSRVASARLSPAANYLLNGRDIASCDTSAGCVVAADALPRLRPLTAMKIRRKRPSVSIMHRQAVRHRGAVNAPDNLYVGVQARSGDTTRGLTTMSTPRECDAAQRAPPPNLPKPSDSAAAA